MVLEKNYTVQQACGALNVGETALRRWVKQYGNEQQGMAATGYQALTPEQRGIQALKKRVQRLEMEKDDLIRMINLGFTATKAGTISMQTIKNVYLNGD